MEGGVLVMRGRGWSFAAQRSLDRDLTTFSEHYLYAQRRDLNGFLAFYGGVLGFFLGRRKRETKGREVQGEEA